MVIAQAETVSKIADRASDVVAGQGIFAVLFVATLLAIGWFSWHVYRRLEPHVIGFVESTVSLHNSLQANLLDMNRSVETIQTTQKLQDRKLDVIHEDIHVLGQHRTKPT